MIIPTRWMNQTCNSTVPGYGIGLAIATKLLIFTNILRQHALKFNSHHGNKTNNKEKNERKKKQKPFPLDYDEA